jgi:hypothetical protein
MAQLLEPIPVRHPLVLLDGEIPCPGRPSEVVRCQPCPVGGEGALAAEKLLALIELVQRVNRAVVCRELQLVEARGGLARRTSNAAPLADDSVPSLAAAEADEKRVPSTPPYRTPGGVAAPRDPMGAGCGRSCRSGVVRGGGEKVAAVVDSNTHGGSCEGEDENDRR